jgi:hypothetical protein
MKFKNVIRTSFIMSWNLTSVQDRCCLDGISSIDLISWKSWTNSLTHEISLKKLSFSGSMINLVKIQNRDPAFWGELNLCNRRKGKSWQSPGDIIAIDAYSLNQSLNPVPGDSFLELQSNLTKYPLEPICFSDCQIERSPRHWE